MQKICYKLERKKRNAPNNKEPVKLGPCYDSPPQKFWSRNWIPPDSESGIWHPVLSSSLSLLIAVAEATPLVSLFMSRRVRVPSSSSDSPSVDDMNSAVTAIRSVGSLWARNRFNGIRKLDTIKEKRESICSDDPKLPPAIYSIGEVIIILSISLTLYLPVSLNRLTLSWDRKTGKPRRGYTSVSAHVLFRLHMIVVTAHNLQITIGHSDQTTTTFYQMFCSLILFTSASSYCILPPQASPHSSNLQKPSTALSWQDSSGYF